MNARLLLPAVVLLSAAVGPGGAAVAPALTVIRSDVRFAGDGDDASRVVLEGDLTVGPGLASVNPVSDAIRVTLGPVVLLDGPAPEDGARVRVTEDQWRLDLRGAPGNPGRVSLRLSPVSGRFTLKAKGVAAAALREAGPAGIAVVLVAGGETYASSGDFEEKDEQRWCYRMPAGSGRPPPGGGGGGGGTLPGGLVTVDQGDSSGITAMRFEVVRDDAAWSSLWREHAGTGTPPSVDFSKEMIVGLWLGMKPTGGYSVRIFRMTAPYLVVSGGGCPPCYGTVCPGAACLGGDTTPGLLVEARETRPGSNCVVTTAITFPFHIVKVPRVEGPGVFSVLTEVRDCP